MAYTPKTWVCGEVITAEDMNHIEEGIADNCGSCNSPLVLTATLGADSGTYTFDQTWEEVRDALLAGQQILWIDDNSPKVRQYQCVETDSVGGTLVAYLLEWNVINGDVHTNHLLLQAQQPNDKLIYTAIA